MLNLGLMKIRLVSASPFSSPGSFGPWNLFKIDVHPKELSPIHGLYSLWDGFFVFIANGGSCKKGHRSQRGDVL